MLITGTVTTLSQAEWTERAAVLDRADAGAAALEQTMLRVFDQVAVLQSLAQTRAQMIEDGNAQGLVAIEQQLKSLAPPERFGILRVVVTGPDGVSPPPELPAYRRRQSGACRPAAAGPARRQVAACRNQPASYRPALHALGDRGAPCLVDRAGQITGYAVASLDPLMLSGLIGGQTYQPGEDSLVQLRDGGAIIARSHRPIAAITEHVSRADPALIAANLSPGGKFLDRRGAIDRLVGFRAPASVPIVVSHTLDTQTALADFFGLQRVVMAVMLALIVGALIATRLVLANFLLRERLSEQAMQDPLTGLRNRRYFRRRADQAHADRSEPAGRQCPGAFNRSRWLQAGERHARPSGRR